MSVENIRIKIFQDKMIIGVMSKRLFNDPVAMYLWFGNARDGHMDGEFQNSLAMQTANLVGMKFKEFLVDGMGYPHTQIFVKEK